MEKTNLIHRNKRISKSVAKNLLKVSFLFSCLLGSNWAMAQAFGGGFGIGGFGYAPTDDLPTYIPNPIIPVMPILPDAPIMTGNAMFDNANISMYNNLYSAAMQNASTLAFEQQQAQASQIALAQSMANNVIPYQPYTNSIMNPVSPAPVLAPYENSILTPGTSSNSNAQSTNFPFTVAQGSTFTGMDTFLNNNSSYDPSTLPGLLGNSTGFDASSFASAMDSDVHNFNGTTGLQVSYPGQVTTNDLPSTFTGGTYAFGPTQILGVYHSVVIEGDPNTLSSLGLGLPTGAGGGSSVTIPAQGSITFPTTIMQLGDPSKNMNGVYWHETNWSGQDAMSSYFSTGAGAQLVASGDTDSVNAEIALSAIGSTTGNQLQVTSLLWPQTSGLNFSAIPSNILTREILALSTEPPAYTDYQSLGLSTQNDLARFLVKRAGVPAPEADSIATVIANSPTTQILNGALNQGANIVLSAQGIPH